MTAGPQSLSSLLWTALHGFERTCVAHAGSQMPSLDLWANLLRALDSTGVDLRELPATLCLSKRALRTRTATAVRHGWADEVKSGRGGAMLRLTPRGVEVAAGWRLLERAAEQRWCAQVGASRAAKLRAALEHVVAAFPLEHPHYPASYGPADARILGGRGVEWKPVLRAHKTVSHLPLYALLSQAIVKYAMDFEELSPVALSLSTSILDRIPAAGLPVRELRNPVGVSALTRHGFIRLSGSGASQKAFLAAKGHAVVDAYYQRIEAVEREWRERFSSERISALGCALEEVAEAERRLLGRVLDAAEADAAAAIHSRRH
jgi:hypothetical protein